MATSVTPKCEECIEYSAQRLSQLEAERVKEHWGRYTLSVRAMEENPHMHYSGVKPQVLKYHINSENYW